MLAIEDADLIGKRWVVGCWSKEFEWTDLKGISREETGLRWLSSAEGVEG